MKFKEGPPEVTSGFFWVVDINYELPFIVYIQLGKIFTTLGYRWEIDDKYVSEFIRFGDMIERPQPELD